MCPSPLDHPETTAVLPATDAVESSSARDCREVPVIPQRPFLADLLEIVGGAVLGLVLSALIIR
jgi:hypothetical protein